MSTTKRTGDARGSDFRIGVDRFEDLQIRRAEGRFHYFYNVRRRQLVKTFVLLAGPKVTHLCHVALIEKARKFTPRLRFSIRDKNGEIVLSDAEATEDRALKASVDLTECTAQLWDLIQYLQSLRAIDIPLKPFSLASQDDSAIVSALHDRTAASVKAIIKELSLRRDVSLSEKDVNQLLKRKQKLVEFEEALNTDNLEDWWQDFLEANKWIFGYGLDYHILRQEQPQPALGGEGIDGTGDQIGDFLSTVGDINFTVLVEIKTPSTPLLQGNSQCRSGTWSLSRELTDALAQIQTNIHRWELRGAEEPINRDRLESKGVYTVKPKGIIVIGLLRHLREPRSKRETFQRFRQSIHGIEILTFDEVHRRARFIVEHGE